MYKLLIISDRPELIEQFQSFQEWDKIGFRTPRFASSEQEAEGILARHHLDACCVKLDNQANRTMTEFFVSMPLLPVLLLKGSMEEMMESIQDLEKHLNRIQQDYSNDRYDIEERMLLARHHYFREVLTGKETDPDKMLQRMMLLRSMMDPFKPCVMMEIGVKDVDTFIHEQWQYGQDRLEVAMRNIFGAEFHGMRILVSVLPDGRLMLVACPMIGMQTPSREDMLPMVREHVWAGMAHVREYLNLEVSIQSEKVIDSLLTLTGHPELATLGR
ncbi:MAG: hypothetical protein IJ083_02260 [Clostridia bacterium]|nr:hypothetical protein [Clostridia bacterium]